MRCARSIARLLAVVAVGACGSDPVAPTMSLDEECEHWLERFRTALGSDDDSAIAALLSEDLKALAGQDLPKLCAELRRTKAYWADLRYRAHRTAAWGLVCLVEDSDGEISDLQLQRQGQGYRLNVFPFEGSKRTLVVRFGPASKHAAEGVYEAGSRVERVYLVNDSDTKSERPGGFLALSGICTKDGCTVIYLSDELSDERTFQCPGCRSVFSLRGERTSGPAPAPLRRVPLVVTPEGELVAIVGAARWLDER